MRQKVIAWWVLVAVALVATACAPAANGTWRREAPVGRDIRSWLIGTSVIDCDTPTFCLALPGADTGASNAPVPNYGELWDGTSWRPVPYPPNGVESLSCVGEWCLIVGASPSGPVATSFSFP